MARLSGHRFQLDAAATLDGHLENCTNRVAEEFKRTLPGIEIAKAGIQTSHSGSLSCAWRASQATDS